MNGLNKYIKRIVLFDILECKSSAFENELLDIYRISNSKTKRILDIINDNSYKRMKKSKQIKFFLNCIDNYELNCWGTTQEERTIIEIKYDILELFQKECGETWQLKDIWKHTDSPFFKSIIGTLYYYGINRTADQKRGEELLIEAAHMGDTDALLWCLWKYPEKTREYMEQLVSLPESLANPEWLDPWKEHYNLWDVKEKQIVKRKIGF